VTASRDALSWHSLKSDKDKPVPPVPQPERLKAAYVIRSLYESFDFVAFASPISDTSGQQPACRIEVQPLEAVLIFEVALLCILVVAQQQP
jgi:hypothetical protein